MKTIHRGVLALLVITICLAPALLCAWGNEGHMAINRAAARHIPKDVPLFFRSAVDSLTYMGPEPDRWRERTEFQLKQAQEPDHFINMERVEGWGELPPGRYDFYKKAYELHDKAEPGSFAASDAMLPDKIGLQPYAALEMYGRLKVAFREYRRLKQAKQPTFAVEKTAIVYAGLLGHYVADAANPMHTTINYNGWVGDNPEGFTTAKDTHSNFESRFVADNLQKLTFDSLIKAPTRLADPWHDYLRYLRDSNAQVRPLYALEKTGAFRGAGTEEGIEFVKARLAAGSQMLLDMWYTAWLESAEPVPAPPNQRSTPGQQKPSGAPAKPQPHA